MAYSPDGQMVATIMGCSIKLWLVATGTLIRTISSGGGANASLASTSLAFSPDGQFIAAAVSVAYHKGSALRLNKLSDGVCHGKTSSGKHLF